MRAPLRTLLFLLSASAAQAGVPDWRVGLGPGVLADPHDDVATRIGGWLEASYEDNDKRPAAGGFNHVNLFADTRWRRLQLFVEGEYERQLSLDGYPGEQQVELEQGYLRWQATDALSLRAGRFNTPFGWWVPIHWSILMDSATPPMYVGNELIPEQQLGVELAGRHFPGNVAGLDSELGWSLFGGYGSHDLGSDHSDGLSAGGDLRLRLAERFLLGASAYRQKNSQLDGNSELNSVLYGEARLPWALTLRSEYVFSHRDPVGQLARNAESLYAALRWDAQRFLYLAYRFGYGDQDDENTLRTGERAIHTITLGILPLPDVKVKLEYNHNELWDGAGSDFDHWVVSVGYSF